MECGGSEVRQQRGEEAATKAECGGGGVCRSPRGRRYAQASTIRYHRRQWRI